MLSAFLLAVSDAFDPRLRRVLIGSILAAVAGFAVLWAVIYALLFRTAVFHHWLIEGAIEVLGGLAALVLTWLLFPTMVLLILGLFLDRIVAAVEARHYPDLPPARPQPVLEVVLLALRLGLIALALNLIALPVYLAVWLNLLLPGSTIVLFYAINGYLAGREYFELVALRRLDPIATRTMRRRRGAQVFAAGIVIAFLFTIPLVNLAAPLIGAAFMLHLFERWRRRAESR